MDEGMECAKGLLFSLSFQVLNYLFVPPALSCVLSEGESSQVCDRDFPRSFLLYLPLQLSTLSKGPVLGRTETVHAPLFPLL